MRVISEKITAVRYKGFILLEQHNKTWLVRPERSPMHLLPFRTPICSLLEVKKILDLKLSQKEENIQAA
ncbi:hypothetical protein [Prochlorococcus marinus]|uniref:Uncharacterized protein n=1 Tax=Prochlorococcus marinus (strain MIT 9211) TaxID=93059 RepID=A9B9D8_PROM4|nr:hypothetical protein [Prochlorococcus marinus]ABX07975.1 Hypothetical protein P9211_00441 [Prochlorococcus marinus str. MIT 9211]